MESFLQNRPSLATVGRSTAQPEGSGDFQPFLRPASSPDKAALLNTMIEDSPSDHKDSEPQIELVRREDCVERIVITCSCCKRIELECEY